ncbi:MAG: hypothetical protein GXX91_14750 [Verrucomicrobiaceae bacterium]|nr:hypothetical protein [Verrucomicrobiaceae bacterium]
MNQSDPNDQAWELLRRAKESEPSPFFVRNVLREVRGLEQERSGPWEGLRALFARPVPLLGATACAALVLAFVLVSPPDERPAPDSGSLALAVPENQSDTFDPASEMASIEYLGQLMAVADPGQIDDAALAELFF